MKLFISYAREDEAVAHLLAYILGLDGITCLLDRGLETGRQFDIQLQAMIKDSDMVLLLLTNASARSPWVNQEIGFAIAHEKLIWPLAIENEIQPHGMLASSQSYALFDWSDPGRTISRLVKALHTALSGDPGYFSAFGMEHVIRGKIERTRFIVDRLSELAKDKTRHLEIRMQAAFSCFAVSGEPGYGRPGEHPPEYLRLLLAERAAMHALAISSHCRLKIILWPVRAYEPQFLAIRFKNLLAWMEEVREVPGVEYVCAQYAGPTRIIAKGDFYIEGFKLHQQSGYQMSVVKYEPEAIDLATREFDMIFDQAGQTKDVAIEKVRAMCHFLSQPMATDSDA